MNYSNPFLPFSTPTIPEGPEHLHLIHDLQAYLAEPRTQERAFERLQRETACADVFRCDPWKYEPLLLDDLLKARTFQLPEEIQQLRGLIRAGSWNTYERQEQDDILKRLKELREIEKQEAPHIDRVIADIRNGVIGEALEISVRTIENINVTAWHQLKRYHGIRGEQAHIEKPNVLTEQLHTELTLIRPIRDLLYFRRLYPVLAQISVQQEPVTA